MLRAGAGRCSDLRRAVTRHPRGLTNASFPAADSTTSMLALYSRHILRSTSISARIGPANRASPFRNVFSKLEGDLEQKNDELKQFQLQRLRLTGRQTAADTAVVQFEALSRLLASANDDAQCADGASADSGVAEQWPVGCCGGCGADAAARPPPPIPDGAQFLEMVQGQLLAGDEEMEMEEGGDEAPGGGGGGGAPAALGWAVDEGAQLAGDVTAEEIAAVHVRHVKKCTPLLL
jgi:hypothetical protein